MSHSAPAESATRETASASNYLKILRGSWPVAGAIFLACLAITLLITVLLPKTYSASATGMVTSGISAKDASDLLSLNSVAQDRTASYVDLAKSRVTAEAVRSRLNLPQSATDLLDQVTVTQPAGTVLITVTTKADSSLLASDMANAWVTALADQVKKVEDPSNTGRSLRVVTVDTAAPPTVPVSPNKRSNLVVGGVVGLLAGLTWMLLRGARSARVFGLDDLERAAGSAHLSVLPRLTSKRGESLRYNETLRRVRTRLGLNSGGVPNAYLIAAPTATRSRSTLLPKLATLSVRAGAQVAVIDANIRQPTQTGWFGVAPGSPGLAEYLKGRAGVEDVLHTVHGEPGLGVINAGADVEASDLLRSQRMATLLGELRQRGYAVLIGSGPVAAYADATMLAGQLDGVVLTVTKGKTREREVSSAIEDLDATGAVVREIVLE